MAQEDKGLVVRGLLLLAFIGCLVAFVLGFMFWRPQPPPPTLDAPPEYHVASLVAPSVGTFPASVPWYALAKLGETMPSAPGWEVRYNAATALARRGSAAVPWALLREMLDEKQQMRNYRVRQPNGQDVYDEAAARANMISALRAVAAWHEKQADKKREAPTELRDIYAMVDKLTESPFVELKVQAEKARSTWR